MTRIAGKVAFVTGGASGIGLGIAAELLRAGARVAIADVEAGALERASAQLASADVLALRLDVTDRAAFAAARDAALARFGAVHLLFNNAGVNADGPLDRASYADWDWVLGVNLGGVVNGLVTFFPELKRHGTEAHVVNTASVGGLVGMRNLGVYNASKFAVVGLSEALRADLRPHGISVSVLCPGVIATALPSSARNRPAALGGAPLPASAAPAAAMPSAMTPAEFALRVRAAIEANEFFVSSHPEFRDLVGQRNDAVRRSFRGEPAPEAVTAMRALIEPFAPD